MDGADIVILSQREERDPRDEETRATVRVVLHRCAKRVLVDISRGTDAAGSPLPVRLDPHAPDVAVDDIRGAYAFLERTIDEWYERAVSAERRVTEAESRAHRAESRARVGHHAIPLPAADPKARAKQRVTDLFALAGREDTPEHERAKAATLAAKLMVEHSLSVK